MERQSYDELRRQQAEEKALRNQNNARELQSRIDLHTEIERVIAEAEEVAKQTVLPDSKKERTARIRENRAEEKEGIRKDEAFDLGDTQEVSGGTVLEAEKKPLHPITALIKRMAEENYDE